MKRKKTKKTKKMRRRSKIKKSRKDKKKSIRELSIEILKRKPKEYRTTAKRIVKEKIGSRELRRSPIRGRLDKSKINRAIIITFSHKYKRLIKKKKKSK